MGILFILKFPAQIGIFTEIICIWKRIYCWNKHILMLTFNFDFQNYQNLCPNLQKPPLPSKISGYAPGLKLYIGMKRDYFSFFFIDIVF